MINKFMISLQKYFFIKKPFLVLRNNLINISVILQRSKLVINGEDNEVSISSGNFKRMKININGNNNNLIIEENSHIRNLDILIQGNNHEIRIGSSANIGGASLVCCGQTSKILIGKDSLLASGINIKSCDGHAIYQDDKVINNSKEIIIGNMVWLAQNVTILKGVNIGNNSVVGINSTVTSNNFPENVILGGSPAKVLKTDINWGRETTF